MSAIGKRIFPAAGPRSDRAITIRPAYELLKTIDNPSALRALDGAAAAARRRAAQLHLESVSQTAATCPPNLGTVELTIALHYVFQHAHDRIVWDVGHQTYPHKILTGAVKR